MFSKAAWSTVTASTAVVLLDPSPIQNPRRLGSLGSSELVEQPLVTTAGHNE